MYLASERQKKIFRKLRIIKFWGIFWGKWLTIIVEGISANIMQYWFPPWIAAISRENLISQAGFPDFSIWFHNGAHCICQHRLAWREQISNCIIWFRDLSGVIWFRALSGVAYQMDFIICSTYLNTASFMTIWELRAIWKFSLCSQILMLVCIAWDDNAVLSGIRYWPRRYISSTYTLVYFTRQYVFAEA